MLDHDYDYDGAKIAAARATLGIKGNNDTPPLDQLTQAFHTLAKRWHPDRNPDNPEGATKKFVPILAAYEYLKEVLNRRRKDSSNDFVELTIRKINETGDQYYEKKLLPYLAGNRGLAARLIEAVEAPILDSGILAIELRKREPAAYRKKMVPYHLSQVNADNDAIRVHEAALAGYLQEDRKLAAEIRARTTPEKLAKSSLLQQALDEVERPRPVVQPRWNWLWRRAPKY